MEENLSNQLDFIEDLRNNIFNDKIMLSYRGEISQEIILALLEMTRKKLDRSPEERGLKSRIFNVMIECLQNISFHSDENEHSKSSMFNISRLSDGYKLYTGNAVRKDKVPELKSKLDKINQMNGNELNEFYRLLIRTREIESKKGMGLGLIDIARKTGNDLDYDFEEIDGEYSYFSLSTVVKYLKS